MRSIRFVVIVLFLSINFNLYAYTRQEYIQMHARAAVEEMLRSGVPASITLAQGCLESGNGNSELSLKSNNHFGIKCHGWSGKGMRYNDDAPNECFRVYDSVSDSYADHSDFLARNSRYAFLFDLKVTDYKGWAHGLKKAGYATDPNYANKLIKIIEENDLSRYDQMSLKDFKQSGKGSDVSAAPSTGGVDKGGVSLSRKSGVVEINSCKAVYVQLGDSPQVIADRYGLKLWEIYNYNDFPDSYRLTKGEVVYLQKKKKKADRSQTSYVVKSGDSMHSISQRYGIRLKNLYKMNDLDEQYKIEKGKKLRLR